MRPIVKNFVSEQLERLPVSGDCLEVGSLDVNGNLHEELSEFNYTGLDMRKGRNVDIVANGNSIPFDNESFDLAVCVETLEHDKCFWKTIGEMKRVLKKNGVIILTAPTIGFVLHSYPNDYWRFTEEGLKSLISSWCCSIESKKAEDGIFVAGRKV